MSRLHPIITKLDSLGVVRPAEKAHCFCQAPYPEALGSVGRSCEERKGEVGILNYLSVLLRFLVL